MGLSQPRATGCWCPSASAPRRCSYRQARRAGSIASATGDGHTALIVLVHASTTALCISTSNQGNGLAFNTDQLSAAAGAHVTLTYRNDSAIPHDWHLFDGADASAASIASTGIKAGPNDVETVSFMVPSTPGRYFFQMRRAPDPDDGLFWW